MTTKRLLHLLRRGHIIRYIPKSPFQPHVAYIIINATSTCIYNSRFCHWIKTAEKQSWWMYNPKKDFFFVSYFINKKER
jgi:hypothetical protein